MIDFNIFVYLAIAIAIMWATSLSFIERKKKLLFFPFFIFGVMNCFSGALVLAQGYNIVTFTFVDLIYVGLLIWIFVDIWRGQN